MKTHMAKEQVVRKQMGNQPSDMTNRYRNEQQQAKSAQYEDLTEGSSHDHISTQTTDSSLKRSKTPSQTGGQYGPEKLIDQLPAASQGSPTGELTPQANKRQRKTTDYVKSIWTKQGEMPPAQESKE